MRLVIVFFLLSLAYASSTQEVRLSKLGGTPLGNDPPRPYADLSFSASSTTKGWDDLYSRTNSTSHPDEYELASSPGEGELSSGALLSDRAAPSEFPADREKPGNATGVIAVVLCLGALRLYFTSPGFRKFLWETFSPLSPLGY